MGWLAAESTKDNNLNFSFDDYIDLGIIPKLNKKQHKLNYISHKKLRTKKLPYIYDINHFCDLSRSSSKQVKYFLTHKDIGYSTFSVPKKNGALREINAPSKFLKHIQRWILDNILYHLDIGTHSHGFFPGRSIVSNASAHVGQDLVLGIDLKDFFPNIHFTSVYHIFQSAGYTEEVANFLADLCTYHRILPQGAPTSPMLANLAAVKLDNKIAEYCMRRKLQYTRYADDITISGSYKIAIYKNKIHKIIEDNGFVVNIEKTRILSRGSSQKVTGLVVNDKVSIGRKRKKTLRAIVHNILVNGPEIENRTEDPFFKEKIFGDLAFAKMIDPDFATPLIKDLKSLDWTNYDKKTQELRKGELVVRSYEKNSYTKPVDTNQTIESEDDLLQTICNAIAEIKQWIEDRREIQPYWDEARKIRIANEEREIPATPKNEKNIQPTLGRFFVHRLLPLGIQTIRESDEGIGILDFKFLLTTKENIPLNVCAEFKLAHHERLEHGLTKQLPLYLKASPSKSGVFLVMWFKDENGIYFREPSNKNKSEMLKYLEEKVKDINEKEGFTIKSILIDASKRPPASKS